MRRPIFDVFIKLRRQADWWRKYVGLGGDVIGIDSFGESAPGNILFEHFGFTKEQIISKLGL